MKLSFVLNGEKIEVEGTEDEVLSVYSKLQEKPLSGGYTLRLTPNVNVYRTSPFPTPGVEVTCDATKKDWRQAYGKGGDI